MFSQNQVFCFSRHRLEALLEPEIMKPAHPLGHFMAPSNKKCVIWLNLCLQAWVNRQINVYVWFLPYLQMSKNETNRTIIWKTGGQQLSTIRNTTTYDTTVFMSCSVEPQFWENQKNTIELNHFRSSPTPKIVLEPLYIYTHIYVKRYQYTATPSWPKTLLKHMCVTKQVIMPGPWPSIQTHHAHHHHDPCNVLFFKA